MFKSELQVAENIKIQTLVCRTPNVFLSSDLADMLSKYFPHRKVRTGLSFIPVNQASLLYFSSLISLVYHSLSVYL